MHGLGHHEDVIEEIIADSLEDAGVTNEPPVVKASSNPGETAESIAAAVKTAVAELKPQPSILSMDIMALREQTLSEFTSHSQNVIS
jgi:hypothetical protein